MNRQSGNLAGGEEVTVSLCGLPHHALTEEQTVAEVMRRLDAGEGGWLFSVNVDVLRRWVLNPGFRQTMLPRTLCLADGMPLIWASKLQGEPLPSRVAGSDLISSISAAAATHGHSIYLLGGAPGTAETAAQVLTDKSPDLQIAGTACPPLGFEKSPETMHDIRDAIVRANPAFVFVALGSPKQENLIAWLRQEIPGVYWMGVGASFSFLAGDIQRAPQWMRKTGLEWLYRMGQDPGRLVKRYLVDNLPFLVRLFGSALRRRFQR